MALAVYWPGLHGGFLFDDYGNLPALGSQGALIHWATFWRYITSGTADPTGRPLAMLSFLLDARDWPVTPFPFKRTNLILYLLNGVLLYALLLRLGKTLAVETRRAQWAAVLGCSLWLLHPLLVSTTLYIVQREAMLVATCSLIGLLLWLHGRAQLVQGHLAGGTAWSTLGLGGFTLLGTLAKANGALLPLYALLIEVIVLRPRQPLPSLAARRVHHLVIALFCLLPSIALLAYLLWTGIHGLLTGGPVGVRPWSIGQRLLTEPRVLMDYLKLLWLPRPFTSGLFNDQFEASTSLLHPATTLTCLLAVATLISGAYWQRRKHPALALAVLFYFAGQSMESSSLPLELYFEHRNYVPALLMFWPLGLWLADLGHHRAIKFILMAVLPLTLAGMTHARAEVWGNVRTQALIWARINPDSPRAQANAAEFEMQNGQPRVAAHQLRALLAAQPDQAQLAFNLIDAECMLGSIDTGTLAVALGTMRHTPPVGTLFVRWFGSRLPLAMEGSCHGLDLSMLSALIDAGMQNPKLKGSGPRQDLIYLRGRIALAKHEPDRALEDFQNALNEDVRPSFALSAAATLGASGYPRYGLQLLDHYEQVHEHAEAPGMGMPMLHAWVLARQHYWIHELALLQATLQAQASSSVPTKPALQPHQNSQ
jgi:tetratricopeptide (TPR) repeat protein